MRIEILYEILKEVLLVLTGVPCPESDPECIEDDEYKDDGLEMYEEVGEAGWEKNLPWAFVKDIPVTENNVLLNILAQNYVICIFGTFWRDKKIKQVELETRFDLINTLKCMKEGWLQKK